MGPNLNMKQPLSDAAVVRLRHHVVIASRVFVLIRIFGALGNNRQEECMLLFFKNNYLFQNRKWKIL